MIKKKILIVGGGFGGIKVALDLSKDPRLEITLISERLDFRYYPSLYHTATGGVPRQSSIPLSKIFEDKNVQLVSGMATKLDKEKRILELKNGSTYKYDVLVLALGVTTNYFGIKGLDKFSYGIKSIEDAEKLKKHLHQELIDEHKPDLNYVIVGGGPTGIELAGALADYLKVIMKNHGIRNKAVHLDIVEATPHLLPRLPKDMSKAVAQRLRRLGVKVYLGESVQGETADKLMINGKPLASHTVIWTAGVANNPFFGNNKFELTDHGKVAVDKYLQVAEDLYVIGDNANTPFSGMAQTAIYDANFVASNILGNLDGKAPQTYKPKTPITVIPAGPHWAAVQWGRFQFYGRAGWIIRELADLIAFHDLEPLLPAAEQWVSEFSEEEDCPTCAKVTST